MGRGAASTRRVCSSKYQTARINFEFHVCVTWMRMPRTALELPDSSEQKTRLVVRDDPPLNAERVSSAPQLQAAACKASAPGSDSPLRRGGGAAHRAVRVLSRFAVVHRTHAVPHKLPRARWLGQVYSSTSSSSSPAPSLAAPSSQPSPPPPAVARLEPCSPLCTYTKEFSCTCTSLVTGLEGHDRSWQIPVELFHGDTSRPGYIAGHHRVPGLVVQSPSCTAGPRKAAARHASQNI